MKHDSTLADGIRANLKALHKMLKVATQLAENSSESMARQQQNLAIGTLVPVEDLLAQATTLFNAVIALHHCKAQEAI